MELVDGKPIIEYYDDDAPTIRQRLELFGQVCRAVQHAHQKGNARDPLRPVAFVTVSAGRSQ